MGIGGMITYALEAWLRPARPIESGQRAEPNLSALR